MPAKDVAWEQPAVPELDKLQKRCRCDEVDEGLHYLVVKTSPDYRTPTVTEGSRALR